MHPIPFSWKEANARTHTHTRTHTHACKRPKMQFDSIWQDCKKITQDIKFTLVKTSMGGVNTCTLILFSVFILNNEPKTAQKMST